MDLSIVYSRSFEALLALLACGSFFRAKPPTIGGGYGWKFPA
jgi:hypothetical protein